MQALKSNRFESWCGGFENLAREHAFIPLRVEGKLPAVLRGTLYRNGPGRFDVAGERYRHWFDSDGAVTAVRLDGTGGALGATKLVATPWREREKRAGRRLYGGWDTPLVRPIRDIVMRDQKNVANTNVMVRDGRLYAMCEIGKPFELSTEDLETVGEVDFDGVVSRAFSAHPHRVPSRATTYGFGSDIFWKTNIECYALPDGERARRIGSFALDGARINHDFAVTPRHLIFFCAPVYISLASAIRRQGIATTAKFDAAKGTEIVIVPIDDPSRIVRFTVDAFYMEHILNAFELPGGEIAIDYTHYADLRAVEDWAGSIMTGAPKRALDGDLRRAIVNPNAKTLRTEILLDDPAEMPRVSPLVEASRHRYAYCVAETRGTAGPWDAVLKLDTATSRVERYTPGPGRYPSEAVFVPRDEAGAEDDGFLLTLVFDARSRTSHLEVLDASHLDGGPIASCHFDQAIPFGFHGAWAPAR
jgi:all-trans-8'-apo-beta-carotenal 15,15'-oxygenase